jgi:mannosyl-oligosaccharide glucosidase
MALAARAMATIGANLGLPRQQVAGFQREAALLEDLQALNALHLHPATGEYRDWGNHTEDVALQRPLATLPDGRQVATGEQRRVVVGRPPSPQLVPQFSYISLFPLLMRLIPPHSPLLGRQLELLGDPQRLWTPHGLRSLRCVCGGLGHGRGGSALNRRSWAMLASQPCSVALTAARVACAPPLQPVGQPVPGAQHGA